MSDLKPCRICRKAPIVSGDWATCHGDHYVTDHTMIQLKTQHWNHLMDDAPDLRYVRIGLRMAAKYLDSQIMALPKEHTISYAELSRARTHFSMQAKMPDTDIMKEISRE